MIVVLVGRYGEQLRVQLGGEIMALVVDLAVAQGWALYRV